MDIKEKDENQRTKSVKTFFFLLYNRKITDRIFFFLLFFLKKKKNQTKNNLYDANHIFRCSNSKYEIADINHKIGPSEIAEKKSLATIVYVRSKSSSQTIFIENKSGDDSSIQKVDVYYMYDSIENFN